MGKFIWWEPTESVDHNFAKEEELTTAEAQVLATLALTEAVEAIGSQLKEFMYFLENHSVSVDLKSE